MKINVNDIPGYEDMTAEEKVTALETMEVTDTDTERKYKDLISKANSEAKRRQTQGTHDRRGEAETGTGRPL